MIQKMLTLALTIITFTHVCANDVTDWKTVSKSLDPAQMKQLSGGYTNKVYLFTHNKRQYVIKYHNKHSNTFGISRQKELKFQNMAAARDLAPKVAYQDTTSGITITEYIPGIVFNYRSFDDPKLFIKAINLMKGLHKNKHKVSPPQKCGFVIFDHLKRRLKVIRKSQPKDLELIEKAFSYVKEVYDSHPSFSDLVSIHGDFFSYNIVDDGDKLRVIDWEYSDWGTPYIDMASLMVVDNLDFEKIELALNSYFENPTEIDRKCLQGTALIYRLSSVFYFKLLMLNRHDARLVKYQMFYDLHMKRFWEQLSLIKKDSEMPNNLKTALSSCDSLSG